MNAAAIVLFPVVGIAIAVIVAFIVIAVIQVIREPGLPLLLRALWIIVLVAAPVLGTLIWFAFGQAINRRVAQDI